MFENYNLNRNETLLNEVLIVDGQPGSGKTLFTQIFGSLERVEHFNYSTEIENICGLIHLGKIEKNAAKSMLKIQLDQLIYETMMSRRSNFRYSDLSSVFKSPKFVDYIKRLFSKGDEIIPRIINTRKPILHILTHNLLPYSEIIFQTFKEKLKYVEIIRHPLYMIIQQTLNQQNFYNNSDKSRQFHLCFEKDNNEFFYWNIDYIDEFVNCLPVERAILEIKYFFEQSNLFKSKNKKFLKQLITIPFEQFALKPDPILNNINLFIGTKNSKNTKKILLKNKIPRKKISDSISLDIYKRCGWEPPIQNFDEKEELNHRRNFIIKNNARKKYIDIIDKLSYEYEDKYMKSILNI